MDTSTLLILLLVACAVAALGLLVRMRRVRGERELPVLQ